MAVSRMVQSQCFNQFFASAFGKRRPGWREIFLDFDPFERFALARAGLSGPNDHLRDAFGQRNIFDQVAKMAVNFFMRRIGMRPLRCGRTGV